MPKKQINFRVTEEQDKHLEEIAKVMNTSKNEVIVNMIEGEYDRLMGNPKLMEIIGHMNQLKSQLEEFTK